MKKLFLILLLISPEAFAASGNCHRQSNPMGYEDYNVCEVTGTGYSCVTVKDKSSGGIACFPTPEVQEQSAEKTAAPHKKYKEQESW